MNLDHLFCESVKALRIVLQDIDKDFDAHIIKIAAIVDGSYANKDEDVEDLGDIVMLLGESSKTIIADLQYTDEQVSEIIKVRKYAKKQLNKKYREGRDNVRSYWQCEDARQQYIEHVTYVWKPCVSEIVELAKKHRPHLTKKKA
jgi:hypothetical protein